MQLGERIKYYRTKLGIGPDELARRSGVSRTAIFGIESGKTADPRARTVRDIARALGVEYDDLVGPDPPKLGAMIGVDMGAPAGDELVTTFVHDGRHYELRSHPVSSGPKGEIDG